MLPPQYLPHRRWRLAALLFCMLYRISAVAAANLSNIKTRAFAHRCRARASCDDNGGGLAFNRWRRAIILPWALGGLIARRTASQCAADLATLLSGA